jgi:hypothetical protein
MEIPAQKGSNVRKKIYDRAATKIWNWYKQRKFRAGLLFNLHEFNEALRAEEQEEMISKPAPSLVDPAKKEEKQLEAEQSRKLEKRKRELAAAILQRWYRHAAEKKKIVTGRKKLAAQSKMAKEERAAITFQRVYRNKLKIKKATVQYHKMKNQPKEERARKIKEEQEKRKKEMEQVKALHDKENKAAAVIQRSWKRRKARIQTKQRLIAKTRLSPQRSLFSGDPKKKSKLGPVPAISMDEKILENLMKKQAAKMQLKPMTLPKRL